MRIKFYDSKLFTYSVSEDIAISCILVLYSKREVLNTVGRNEILKNFLQLIELRKITKCHVARS